jgi:hypothetical protein
VPDHLLEKFFPKNSPIAKIFQKFLESITSESADEFLDLLLRCMAGAFKLNLLDSERNIKDFTANTFSPAKRRGLQRQSISKTGKMEVLKEQ